MAKKKIDVAGELNAATVDGILGEAQQINVANKNSNVEKELSKALYEGEQPDKPVVVGEQINADFATKALQDSESRVIKNTYATNANLGIPIFDVTKAYNVGDVVFYETDGKYYEFTQNHAVGAWNSNQVKQYIIKEEINDILYILESFSKKDITMNDSLSILKSQFDNCILNIAYSQLNDDIAPINTETHFNYAISKGFNVLKADMRLTKDNKIVLCHDAGFTLNEDGRIIGYDEDNNILIRNLDRDSIINLEHSYFYDSLGKYEHPMTLEKFLVICKINNVIPYITFRSEYIEETLNALTPILEKFNYTHKCIINVNPQNIDTCYQIRKYLPFIPICHTLNSTVLITKDIINQVYRIGNGYLCANINALDNIDKEVFDYSRNKEIRIFGWFVSDKESYKKYISNGFCGFQITDSKAIEK